MASNSKPESPAEFETPQEVLVELAKALEETRGQRLEAEPEDRRETYLSGYESGLREAVMAFEDLDGYVQIDHLPEWQIGLENKDGDWEWYYPHAVTREKALEKARGKAQEELGDGYLNAYEVGGPLAY